MTNGLFSDMFVQAEIDYRRDRALADMHGGPRLRRADPQRRWHLTRSNARPALRSQRLVD